MNTSHLHTTVACFAASARRARQAGFTGVQVHGAHGYLVSQFLSPRHNRRTDAWGGTPEKRRRFLLAVVAAIREAVGAGFPLGVKLNSADFQRGGFDEDESLACVAALAAAGVDLLEVSGGTYENPAMTGLGVGPTAPKRASTRAREAYFLAFATRARAVAGAMPLMLTGGFRSAAGMAEAVRSGAVDVVGLARPLATDPGAPRRLLSGAQERLAEASVATGVGFVDRLGLLEVAWYTRRLHEIADGRPTRPEAPLPALAWTLADSGLSAAATRLGVGRATARARAWRAGGSD